MNLHLMLQGGDMPDAWANEREYKIEAALLYSFFNYITWPAYDAPEEMDNATICIQRGDPVHPYLNYVQYKMRGERELYIEEIADNAPLRSCQVFFTRDPMTVQRLAEAVDSHVLVVSDIPGFVSRGGMIGLVLDGSRLTTEINNSLLRKAGFHVSSRLLSLAREVQ